MIQHLAGAGLQGLASRPGQGSCVPNAKFTQAAGMLKLCKPS